MNTIYIKINYSNVRVQFILHTQRHFVTLPEESFFENFYYSGKNLQLLLIPLSIHFCKTFDITTHLTFRSMKQLQTFYHDEQWIVLSHWMKYSC